MRRLSRGSAVILLSAGSIGVAVVVWLFVRADGSRPAVDAAQADPEFYAILNRVPAAECADLLAIHDPKARLDAIRVLDFRLRIDGDPRVEAFTPATAAELEYFTSGALDAIQGSNVKGRDRYNTETFAISLLGLWARACASGRVVGNDRTTALGLAGRALRDRWTSVDPVGHAVALSVVYAANDFQEPADWSGEARNWWDRAKGSPEVTALFDQQTQGLREYRESRTTDARR